MLFLTSRMGSSHSLSALLGVAIFLCVASAVAELPLFPSAYHAKLSQLVEIGPSGNVSWRNAEAIFHRQLQSAKLSGALNGMALTNLDLFSSATRFVISARLCRKEPLGQKYSDPLELIRFTTYAGTTTINGRVVQQWSYRQASLSINIYTTNDSIQQPVQLFFSQGPTGVLIDYASFSSGSSSEDFRPPASCGQKTHPSELRLELHNIAFAFRPIFDFLAACCFSQ